MGRAPPQRPIPVLARLTIGNTCSVETHILSYKPESIQLLRAWSRRFARRPNLRPSLYSKRKVWLLRRITWPPNTFRDWLFGYRVKSPGRQTKAEMSTTVYPFGYRVKSPGRQTVADGAAGRMPNLVSKPDEKAPVFLLRRPGTGGFPSDTDLHRRRFPPQRRYRELFYRIRCPSSSGNAAARQPGARHTRFRSAARAEGSIFWTAEP